MKKLALDIGNVLCKVDQDLFVNRVSEKMNLSLEHSARFMKRIWELHDIGFTTIQDELTDKFGVKSEIIMNDLLGTWNNVVIPDPTAIRIINGLIGSEDVQIAFLSNMGVEHMESMKHKLAPIYDNALKHFSCEVGARKPSKLFYQSFLMQYPEFKGAVYVDDLSQNLEAAAQFGFVPYHFDLNKHSYDKLSNVIKLFTS